MTPYTLLDLQDPDQVHNVKKMSDADIGGFSTVNVQHVAVTGKEPAHARFYGTISTELPRNQLQVQRSGFAGWRNHDRPFTLLGKSVWNIDPYTFLGLRVKSDGRKYFVNLQTETIVPTDIHQHRLYTRRPGEWETVLIKWNDFVRTNHGVVVEPQTELLRQSVRTIGMSLIDRIPGPYDLSISKVWATNDPEGRLPDEDAVDSRAEQDRQYQSAHPRL